MRLPAATLILIAPLLLSAQPYDLLLKGGHVIDPKNKVNAVRDVAITNGKVARVAADLPASQAKRVANVTGLYVIPGIVDIHAHMYTGTGLKGLTGDSSLYPDPMSFRSGVTTMVDAGSAGWRNFPDFKQRVIDRAQTRVLAFINIVAEGMGPKGENNPADMVAEEAAKVAKQYPHIVVGFKTAHYSGPGWPSIDAVTKAGRLADLPVMVDFGTLNHERNLKILFEEKLRAGDIYTHCFSGHRDEAYYDKQGKLHLNPAMLTARKRGIYFDIGHGGASFYFHIADAALKAGFLPDSISSDLHTGSMNKGFKDMPNLMSKLMNMGIPLENIIRMSTWNPAQQIKHPELGHLSEGAVADVAVLRLDKGQFGFLDGAGARRGGELRLSPELTLRAGQVVWDLNGRAATDWTQFPYERDKFKDKTPPAPARK